MSKINTEIETIQSQIDGLIKKQGDIFAKAKSDTEKKINDILNSSGFSLSEIFPNQVKKQAEPDNKIVINKIEYIFKKRVSKEIKQALLNLNLNPDEYNAEKLITEFGA